jgi:hypothetical protein
MPSVNFPVSHRFYRVYAAPSGILRPVDLGVADPRQPSQPCAVTTTLVLAASIGSAARLLERLAWLIFCWCVFKRTGDASSLREVATVARAYRRRK